MARMRRLAAKWVELIDQWQASGPSLPAFSERNGVSVRWAGGFENACEIAGRWAGTTSWPTCRPCSAG